MSILDKNISPPNLQKAPKTKNQTNSTTLTAVTAFSGPIPPPNFLEQYEVLVPGIAKKFLEEPHLEAEHRRSLEKLVVEEKIKISKRGQAMAFFLATLSIMAAFTTIFFGYDIAGLGALFLSIASFVGIFIYAKKQQS